MKIRLRLVLLLACLFAVFAVAAVFQRESHRREAATLKEDLAMRRETLLDRLLVLTGQSLRSYASDYSLWNEMLAFVQSADLEWAEVNIDASIANFDIHAVWVLRPDGSLVYRTGELDAAIVATLPFAQPEFISRLRQDRLMHFYLESPQGLLEVRTSPVQPSDDIARASEPRGWLIVARLWANAHLRTLEETLQSEVSFQPSGNRDPATIHLTRTLSDWTGRPVRTLYVTYESLAISRLLAGNEDETYVLFFMGLSMMLVTAFGLSRWVIIPLNQLGRSLETGRPESLQALRGQPNEFGHLARLVEQSFTQRHALEIEVRERSRLAESLQETSGQLRESIELRNRLARDLHDGVIQAIYAAGLGIEGVRSTMQTDPVGAAQRLAACTTALNDTIRNVRAFINGLESEGNQHRPFRQTVSTLVATMQAIQPGNIAVAVDEAVARRISPAQELQILHVLRESISNALRHADPAAIHISLQAGEGQGAVLAVADDGCGFDRAKPGGSGRGLVNLGIRAREMGGSLEIDSAPGKGTRITLRFNPTYPP